MGDVNLIKSDGTKKLIAEDLKPAVGVSVDVDEITRFIALKADVSLHNASSATVSVYFGGLVRRTKVVKVGETADFDLITGDKVSIRHER